MYKTQFDWEGDIYMEEYDFSCFVGTRNLPVFEADGYLYTVYEGFVINKGVEE